MSITLPQHLTSITPWRSMEVLALDWLFIAGCFACAIYFPHPFVYLITAVLIARTQLALAVLMHESAHGVLTGKRKTNDFIGQVLTAGPLMLSMFAYRRGHMRHHRAPMASDDPVAVIFGIGDYPVSRKQLAWRLFKDLTSISYFLSIRDLFIGKHRNLTPRKKTKPGMTALVIVSILATNGLMFGVLAALGHAWLYPGLWILPALTFLQLFARIRAITEHAGYPPGEDQIRNARSVVRSNWQTFFVGPHCIHYHIEHHQYVRVPFYHLRETHQFMHAQGLLPAENLYHSYAKVLRDVTCPLSAEK